MYGRRNEDVTVGRILGPANSQGRGVREGGKLLREEVVGCCARREAVDLLGFGFVANPSWLCGGDAEAWRDEGLLSLVMLVCTGEAASALMVQPALSMAADNDASLSTDVLLEPIVQAS